MENFSNSTSDLVHDLATFHTRLFLEIFSAISLVSIIVDFLLIFVILKYRKLRNQTTNQIIAHLSLLNSIFLITSPLTLRLNLDLDYFANKVLTLCVLHETEGAVLFGVLFFTILLPVDWYLKKYKQTQYSLFRKSQKFAITFAYLFVISVIILSWKSTCPLNLYPPLMILVDIFATISTIIVIAIINVINWSKNRNRPIFPNRTNVGLALANIFAILWIPALICFIIIVMGFHYFHVAVPLIMFVNLGFCTSIGNFIYLFLCEPDFNLFFKRIIFKCDCRKPFENRTETYYHNGDPLIPI